MDTNDTDGPPEKLILDQLEKILASEIFRVADKQSELLEYTVRAALDKKPLSDKIIGSDIFKNYIGNESTHVRVNFHNLRKNLNKYYIGEGRDDPVIIDIPKKAYKSIFSYNPSSEAARICKIVSESLWRRYPCGSSYRSDLLEKLLNDERYRGHPLLLLKVIEGDIWAMVDNDISNLREVPPIEVLRASKSKLLTFLGMFPDLWDAHLLCGLVCVCLHEWTEAKIHYDRALDLAPLLTSQHGYYAIYLLTQGEIERGANIVCKAAEDNPDDATAQIVHGIFLYATGNLNQARDIFEREMRRGKHGLAHIMWAYVRVSPQSSWQAKETFLIDAEMPQEQDLFDFGGPFDEPTNAVFAGNQILTGWACMNFEPDADAHADQNGDTVVKHSVGLVSYCIGKAGIDTEGDGGTLQDIPENPFHFALGYLGRGEIDWAIHSLNGAAQRRELPMIWLHLWPIFDPIRHYPTFQAILKKIGLPQRPLNHHFPAQSEISIDSPSFLTDCAIAHQRSLYEWNLEQSKVNDPLWKNLARTSP